MCQVINAACLLANVFDTCRKRESFSLREIRKIVEQIEVASNEYNVLIDWTKPSVMEAFDLYHDLFMLSDGIAQKKLISMMIFLIPLLKKNLTSFFLLRYLILCDRQFRIHARYQHNILE